MKKIVVLGAGMVGSAIAVDLCKEFDVTAADLDAFALSELVGYRGIQTVKADLSDAKTLKKIVESADLVIGAVPGFLGYKTLETLIRSRKNVVDISFFPEDPFDLDDLAREMGVVAVIDCGVAPGMSNIILGYHNERMEVRDYTCLVGGVPVKRIWPYQYKAPFSPIDVIEEYIRPAKYVEDGKIVTKPALSDPEYVEFDAIGTLESFNTDGLRTLIRTMNVPFMVERTLRYPGHIEYIRVLRESGFFDKEPVDVKGAKVRPIDLTAALLFPKWKLERGEREITVMRVTLGGRENGVEKRYTYDLFDRTDEATGTSSMARTTGYTCSVTARLVLNGEYDQKGISPPEYLGIPAGCFEKILEMLKVRGVVYDVNEEAID